MYLKFVHIENSGPLRNLHLHFQFTDEGLPKPVVFVGGNGAGKTIFLSTIADALIEAAAINFDDMTSFQDSGKRNFFRTIGPRNVTLGESHQASILCFETDTKKEMYFLEKLGDLSNAGLEDRFDASILKNIKWKSEGPYKKFNIEKKESEEIFSSGTYVYFPSSRSETPHWLNTGSVPQNVLQIQERMQNVLGKPIFCERNMRDLTQWILGVILDARHDVTVERNALPSYSEKLMVRSTNDYISKMGETLSCINRILSPIVNNKTARIACLPRHYGERLSIYDKYGMFIPSLECLSAGQATVFGMFGTLLRYGDMSAKTDPLKLEDIQGICIIDEIDAHLHVDLQMSVVPKLCQLFPKIQFIISTHSPLFVLGMEKTFGPSGAVIIELPKGTPIHAESFREFEGALNAMRETNAFRDALRLEATKTEKALVFVEGWTDALYLNTAAKVLGYQSVLDHVEIKSIGEQSENEGGARNKGKTGLDKAFGVYSANPEALKRRIMILYDNDVRKESYDSENLSVRCMTSKEINQSIQNGIESYLPNHIFSEDMWCKKTEDKKNGVISNVTKLKKKELCESTCNDQPDRNVFEGFAVILDMIVETLDLPKSAESETHT